MTSGNIVAVSSIAFPGAYLRVDGRGVEGFSAHGAGKVNCQFGVANWEKFRIVPQPDGTVALAPISFANVFLRLDGTGVHGVSPTGGGTANCNYGVGAWEKFHLEDQGNGEVAFASAAFPNVHLRLDGGGVDYSDVNGAGIVNCGFGVGSWERFRLQEAPWPGLQWPPGTAVSVTIGVDGGDDGDGGGGDGGDGGQ